MVNLSVEAKNAACQAVVDLLSNGGKLGIYDASNNKLVEFVWTSAVFGTPSNGEATANSVAPVEALMDGTATTWKLQKPNNVDVMWGVVGQRYKIVEYNAVNNTVKVAGNKTSIFVARSIVTLVFKTNPSQNIVVRVDDSGPTFDGTNTVIPIFEDIPTSPIYNFIHLGMLGLDNVDIKESQIVQIGSFKYRVLG